MKSLNIIIIIFAILLIVIIFYNYYNKSFINKIINNSQSFPTFYDIGLNKKFEFINNNSNQAFFIQGGIKYSGRYPDIIITKYDVVRALKNIKKLLQNTKNNTENCLNILKLYTRQLLKTDEQVQFDIINNIPDMTRYWNETFNEYTICKSEIKKDKQLSLTNIMALPYLSNDCREHAWYLGFLLYVYQQYYCNLYNIDCKNEFRIIYTETYIIYEDTKEIVYDEDHAFVLMINNNNFVYIVDAFYLNNKKINNKIVYDYTIIENIDINKYKTYKINNILKTALNNSNLPIFHGGVYIANNKKLKTINIPKIYNNTNKFIDITLYNLNNDNILIYNDVIKFDGYVENPINFNNRCKL